MPQRLQTEYEGSVDNVIAHGYARQDIAHNNEEGCRRLEDLHRAVIRSAWVLVGLLVKCNTA